MTLDDVRGPIPIKILSSCYSSKAVLSTDVCCVSSCVNAANGKQRGDSLPAARHQGLAMSIARRALGCFPPFGGCANHYPLGYCKRLHDTNARCAMKRYCCHILDQNGQINGREIIEGTSDNEVFGRANGYLAQHRSIRAVEIWLEDRYVGKLHQSIALGSLRFVSHTFRGDQADCADTACEVNLRPARSGFGARVSHT